MATSSGQRHSYSNTVALKQSITDRILLTDPNEIVAISVFGLNNEAKFAFVNMPGQKYSWLEDTYRDLSDTLNDADWDTDPAAVAMTVTTGVNFEVGDVIQVDSELVNVTAISSNVLTVVRAFSGSTAATHATDTTINIRYRARIEGASASDSTMTETASVSNYSMIFQKTINVSRTAGLMPYYGMSDPVGYQIQKGLDEQLQALNRAVYRSTGAGEAGSATVARSMAGLQGLISTNSTAASSAALTEKMIQDELQDCWTGNGTPDQLFCGAWAKRKIADFFGGYVRTERSESQGGVEISSILSPLGNVIDVVVDRDCQTDVLYLIDTSLAGYITIDPFFTEELGKTADTAFYGQIVGEFGFVLAQEDAHSYISGFSTTA